MMQMNNKELSLIVFGKSVSIDRNSSIKFETQVSTQGYDVNRIRTTPISRLSILIDGDQIDLWDFDGVHDAQRLSKLGNDLLVAWQAAQSD